MKSKENSSPKKRGKIKNFGISAGIAGSFVSKGEKEPLTKVKNTSGIVVNKSTNTITWTTFPGGPVFQGPARLMIKILRAGKADRQEGIRQLMAAYKSGKIKIIK